MHSLFFQFNHTVAMGTKDLFQSHEHVAVMLLHLNPSCCAVSDLSGDLK